MLTAPAFSVETQNSQILTISSWANGTVTESPKAMPPLVTCVSS